MTQRGFLFPGQGAQTIGMARALYDQSATVRSLFARAQDILGYDLAEVCFHGPAELLNSTRVSQPAIYVASFAALHVLQEKDPEVVAACQAAAGLSLGEYTALAFAGVFTFEDGLWLVRQRAEAMQQAADATPSAMVSVLGLDLAQVETLVQQARSSGRLWIANYLCPGNVVVSGELPACQALERLAAAHGTAKTVRLAVAGAFHTELMQPADRLLAEALQNVRLHPARIPVWSNVDGRAHRDPAEIRSLLVAQVVGPVRWEECMRGMLAAGIEEFYEIGPGRVLAGLLKRIQRKAVCHNVTA
ncbi:MAG: [acyl-carrier-protein] S-malonyltransferase [Gemmataceae bacterium]